MSRLELYSPEGLRVDGRRWKEIRRFECQMNTHAPSDGSSFIEQGNTKVICIVDGPTEPSNRGNSSVSKATVQVNLNIAAFSTIDRKKRLRSDRRIQEMSASIRRTLEQTMITKLYPRTQVTVNLHVLAQDGGVLAACVNASILALIDAGIAVYDYVSAIGVAIYDSTPLLDPNTLEEAELPFLTAGTVGKSEKLALVVMEDKMPLDRLESVLAMAISGCHSVRDLMDKEVRRHGAERISKTSDKSI